MISLTVCIIISVVYVNTVVTTGITSCKNNKGESVDWFIVYKLPKGSQSVKKTKGTVRRTGTEFAYMDPQSTEWQGGLSVNNTANAVYHTLQQIYDNKQSDDLLYVMYNDQRPDKDAPSSRGHSKGVVAFDNRAGFWLVHSVPKFPPFVNDGFSYPESGTVFGQTMLCISLPTSALPSVAQQLLFIYTAMYEKNIPDSFASDPSVQNLKNDVKRRSPPWNNTATIVSTGGQNFISFAKSKGFDQDLYDGFVAPGLQSDLLVETWKNGEPLLPSNCTAKYKVINVEDVQVINVSVPGRADHSKWAIGTSQLWVCVGDINRQETQFRRGGGTVCSQLPAAWKAFSRSVVDSDKCPSSWEVPVISMA